MLDRHARRRIRNWLAGLIGPPLIHAWTRTLRMRWHGDLVLRGRLPFSRTPGIFVFWHQRLFTIGGYYRNSGFRVMISHHSDGEMLARVIEELGMRAVRGSTTRGGSKVLLEVLKDDIGSLHLALTPDGPRGPLHHFHPGAIYLASRTGLPLYPVAISVEKRWALPSWDGFILPRPFSRALIRLGEPERIDADAEKEEIEARRLRMEERLKEITEDTDRRFDELYREARRRAEIPRIDDAPQL
ncbi:MAG: DUF374 domain-containing protein [Planctomycetes bacterium]|nr:DUF374 domain-containing protein [Planctomycetota bacterium]